METEGREVGLVAQEVQKVLPEAVLENETTGVLSVAYQNIVGVLVEAIKEQQKQIEDLRSSIDELQKGGLN